jgi:oxaloacetate decarboxylase gamma subunit
VLAKLAIKFPDPVAAPSRANKKNKSLAKQHGDISPAIVAAISGAVKQYRRQHGQEK